MAKRLPSTYPFVEYKVYGPYWDQKTGRRMVSLKGPAKTSMAYARYLLCIKEARFLESWEDADHIDNNKINDSIDNLQVLPHLENIAKKLSKDDLTFICPQCETEFKRAYHQRPEVKGNKRTFCSRSCAAKFYAPSNIPYGPRSLGAIQHGTRAGYLKERRQGLGFCALCRAANTAYSRSKR